MKKNNTPRKYSRKHHYLPVFYLNGFTNEYNKFFVYNKQKDIIHESLSPSSIFFEKDLNNFKDKDKVLFSLEDDFFMRHDAKAASFLHSYLQNSSLFSEEEGQKHGFELSWFLINLFWRIPNSSKKFDQIVIENGIHNKYFQLINGKTNNPAPKDVIDKIQSDILDKAENRKIFRLVYPFISLDSGEIFRIMNLSKDYSITGNCKLLTGDNPFITKHAQSIDLDNILGEFIFPFSFDRLLILAKQSPTYINMNLLVNINISIIHQSERFVCSGDIENLKEMVRYYKIYERKNLLNNIAGSTFELIYELAGYPTLDDYLKAKKK